MDFKELLWEAIKVDYPEGARSKVEEMRNRLTYATAEMIQVIAMCDKFIRSQDYRKRENE